MEYGLTRKVLGPKAFVPISKDEYESISQSRSGSLELLFLEEKYDLIVENYFEFETTLLEIVSRDMIRMDQSYHSFNLERGLVDRRIANLLMSTKVYVDHAKQHVHRILENKDEFSCDADSILSKQYDARFGYRCMEALRNHVQHRGFPAHLIRWEHKWVERENDKLMMNAISPYVQPERLREDGEFKKAVLKEMEEYGEDIDLKELVRDYIEGLSIAHSEIRQCLRQCADDWDNTLKIAIQHYTVEDPEKSNIGLCAVKKSENDEYYDWISILPDILDQRKYFENKNKSLVNLSKRFITSEIVRNKKT